MKLRAASLVTLVALAAVTACGGNSSEEGGDGGGQSGSGGTASGKGGSSGSAGASGSAGSSTGGRGGTGTSGTSGSGGAVGGDAGSVPTGGTAGTNATGGTAGAGGGGRECETADDCVMFSDCCSCEAMPKGTAPPPTCDIVCITDHCTAEQIDRDAVACSFGRCVIDKSCDHSKSTCDSLPEPCPAGQVRALNDDGCWGPCLAPTECRDVTDCSSCGDAVCVIEEPQIRSFGCVNPGDSCAKGSYCECLDACPQSGFVCTEADDAVHCPCPVC
jgi:hypothetical protein